jgi:hypothetical protein
VAHLLNSEVVLDFSGAPLFAVSAKGGVLVLRFFGRHHNQQKKAGLNLRPGRPLSKICDAAVLVGCHRPFPRVSTPTASQTHPTLREDGEEWGTRKI